jgi:hypothetical protein
MQTGKDLVNVMLTAKDWRSVRVRVNEMLTDLAKLREKDLVNVMLTVKDSHSVRVTANEKLMG